MIKRWLFGLAVGLFSLLTLNGYAQVQKDTLRVLFVGNSYTYFENLPQVVSVLSEQTGMVSSNGEDYNWRCETERALERGTRAQHN